MDGFTNPKIEKQSIYEIYRACRLCGAGAGYKMPIIQNVVDLDSGEVELKHKVRECVQIEVHQDDKMPPLICELCVDKVNDFYEFLEMCRQTNKQTRLRLGLPPQTLPRGAPDAGDCILGVTEPIFVDEDSNEPVQRSKGKTPVKNVKTKESDSRDTKTKLMPKKDLEKEKEKEVDRRSGKHEPRALRRRVPSPPSHSPPRILRGTKRTHEDDVSLSRLQKTRKSDEPMPKSILKRERDSKSEERVKITRLREKEIENKANSQKVVKIMVKKENLNESLKSLPRVRTLSPKPREKTPPPTVHKCKLCKADFKDGRSLSNHMRSHANQNELPKTPPPTVHKCKLCKAVFKDGRSLSNHMRSHANQNELPKTPPPTVHKCKLCKAVFKDGRSLSNHMRSHANQNELPKTPPPTVHKCKLCKAEFKDGRSLSNHMRSHAKQKPVERDPTPPPKKEVKKPECRVCGKQFLSRNMLDIHQCSGRAVKSTKLVREEKPEKPQRSVSKPQRVSSLKKRPEAPIDPELLKQCRPLQVRISKCDPLLENKLGDYYDASDVDYDYGLDKTCVYPYIYTFRHLRIKSEPLYMVNIHDEIKNVLDRDENYVHWDSDETDSDLELSDTKKVDTLTSISLKTLFSQKVLGKVPKKRRKVKVEKAFDSILNSTNDFDSDMRLGIDNIINSLGDDNDKSILDAKSAKNDDNDSLFGDDNSPAIAVTNDDFDSLFSSDARKSNDKNIIDTKSEDSNITNFSMDFTEDVSDKDKSKLSKYSSTVQDSKIESKELNTNNDSLKNDDNDSKNYEDDMNSNDKNNSKNINKSDAENNTSMDDKENNDANSVSNGAKDNEVASTENDSSRTEVNDNFEAENDTEADVNPENKDGEGKNDGNHVNGQTGLDEEFNMDDLEDVSDSEMEETSSAKALDSQIDGKETTNAKTYMSESDKTVTEDIIAASVKSADLENISDGEFE